ncbi:RDD family protein [Millisia brevis]|uniref:RDD family protein n=1 Tax=Millisia brevis TaxID=264148 RepID=UPI00082A1FCF|nr:RDD family protein [Millisia brevis]
MARITGSWLSGPSSALPTPEGGSTHPGAAFGFPADGPGSVAGFGRRTLGLLVDWLIAMGLAAYLPAGDGSGWATVTFLVWFAVGVLAVTFFSFTPGQLVAGIRVARIEGDMRVGFVRALVRQIFLSFVVPAVITDGDNRGMHDRATGTVLIRVR